MERAPWTLNALAGFLRDDNRPEDAERAVAESLELDSSITEGGNRAAYTIRIALLHGRERLGEARKLGEQVLAAHFDDPFALNAVGSVASAQGDRERAEECLTRADELAPSRPDVRLELRRLVQGYLEAGDEDGAARVERRLASPR